MKTIRVTVYEFDELTDAAKVNARDWWRSFGLDYDWWQSTYDDAENIGLKITSFDLDRNRHAKGRFISGACECAWKIEKEHGEQCETFKTAKSFLKERDSIVESAPKDENGEFEDVGLLDENLDECESDFLKSILEDYSIMLQKECEWLTSTEQVDETIRANGYTFTENGERF